MKICYVGFDTSNYTTSMAACDADGRIIANLKIPLPVKEGQRGLRQSDAVFLHVKNLPEIFEPFEELTKEYNIVYAVGASSKPRDAEDSYMPCFLVGKAEAMGYASAAKAPVYFFSHQSGHIMAALYSAVNDGGADMDELLSAPFAAFHVSGGTTEMLYVDPTGEEFNVTLIGETTDLNAGQAIDRAGVMMGLKFPCGPEMERLALENTEKISKPKISVKGLTCCLSGLENLSADVYKKTQSPETTSAYVFEYVAATLDKLTENLRAEYKDIPIIYAGGVMSNSIIKQRLSHREKVYFATPAFSADNAAGIALLCRRRHLREIK